MPTEDCHKGYRKYQEERAARHQEMLDLWDEGYSAHEISDILAAEYGPKGSAVNTVREILRNNNISLDWTRRKKRKPASKPEA